VGAGGPPVTSGASRAVSRLATVVASHPILDAYAGFVPPLIGLLQVRCDLTAWQAASLLSIGPLTSGFCQPVLAWLSDLVDSRLVGSAGLVVAAVCLSCIGLADSFGSLVLLFGVGMLGVGAFHPVAAASVGQLAGSRRSAGVTLFFVAGMAGATAGPVISSRITAIEPYGFDLLRWAMVPGLVVAVLLHLAIRDVSHNVTSEHEAHFPPAERGPRWRAVGVLFVGNAMRFWVNIALLYLYVRWAEATVAAERPGLDARAVAGFGAIYCGELNALMMLGMGLGGLAAGLLVRPGRERAMFILLPMLLAPAILVFPHAGRAASYPLALAGGVGFAAVIPIAISVAQRLLPHRTSLASALMLGAGWGLASTAPPTAEWCLGTLGMRTTFALVAGLLAGSGLIGLLLSPGLMRRVGA
jgi:FSR family fosmidomycin resistance protein-like MFS transporter